VFLVSTWDWNEKSYSFAQVRVYRANIRFWFELTFSRCCQNQKRVSLYRIGSRDFCKSLPSQIKLRRGLFVICMLVS